MWLAISIGLLVVGWMLYRNISETRFIDVGEGRGSYIWQDSNGNGKIDDKLPAEFISDPKYGNFKKETLADTLSEANWSTHSVLWILIALVFMIGEYRDWETDRRSTRLNSSHSAKSRMPSSA